MQSRAPSHNGSSTSIDSILVFTLDPQDKYLPPGVRRAATTSAIKQRRANLAAMPKPRHRAATSEPDKDDSVPRTGQSTLERQRSLLSVFHKLRQTRSAGSNARSGLAWPPKLFSRSGSRGGQSGTSEEIPEVPKLPVQLPNGAMTGSGDVLNLPTQRTDTPPPMPSRVAPIPIIERIESTSRLSPQINAIHGKSLEDLQNPRVQEDGNLSATSILGLPDPSSTSTHALFEKVSEQLTRFAETTVIAKSGVAGHESHGRSRIEKNVQIAAKDAPLEESTLPTHATSSLGAVKCPNMSEPLCPTTHSCATSSYAASDDQSPYLDSNTTHSNPMSPLHLSQPETPVMSEFGDEHCSIRRNSTSPAQLAISDSLSLDQLPLRPPSRAAPPPPASKPATAYSTVGGFQGYSIPDSDHTSVLTIRKLPSTTFKPADNPSNFGQQGAKKELVESWNDGSEHRMSALSELVEDLGYLGTVII